MNESDPGGEQVALFLRHLDDALRSLNLGLDTLEVDDQTRAAFEQVFESIRSEILSNQPGLLDA